MTSSICLVADESSESSLFTERVLHPPKTMKNAWVLYFKERLDVRNISKSPVTYFRMTDAHCFPASPGYAERGEDQGC